MIGLIALFVLMVWALVVFGLAKLLVIPIKSFRINAVVNIVLAIIFFIAPFADEIIGGVQFRELCEINSKIIFDEKTARNKTVFLADLKDTKLDSFWVPISVQHWSYKDIETNQVLVSWSILSAKGGWISQWVGFSTSSPYLFEGSCAPDSFWNALEKLNITVRQSGTE